VWEVRLVSNDAASSDLTPVPDKPGRWRSWMFGSQRARREMPGWYATAYHGVLRVGGIPVWTCAHDHPDGGFAQLCAAAEADRRADRWPQIVAANTPEADRAG
jgi:hypothetical protein